MTPVEQRLFDYIREHAFWQKEKDWFLGVKIISDDEVVPIYTFRTLFTLYLEKDPTIITTHITLLSMFWNDVGEYIRWDVKRKSQCTK